MWEVGLMFVACQLSVFVCIALAWRIWYGREKARLVQQLKDLVRGFAEAPDKDTPSALAVLIDQIALVLAARLVQQLKAMLAGTESGISKNETQQLAMDLGEGNPWLGILAGILPKRLRNQLLRNPQMVGALTKFAAGRNGSGASAQPGMLTDRIRNNQE